MVQKIGHHFEKAVCITAGTSTEESELWWKTKGLSSLEKKNSSKRLLSSWILTLRK